MTPIAYMLPTLVFDASALIASARFKVQGASILDHILSHCQALAPEVVKEEVIDAGLKRGYDDAVLLAERVKSGAIQIMTTAPEKSAFQRVIDDYGIEAGDKDLLWLCRQTPDYQFTVVDDRLLYIILNRFEMRPRFLPDILLWLVQKGYWSENLAFQALETMRPRYRLGFISHSLEILKGSL